MPIEPALSGGVLAAVLLGALLHAGWNALVKSSTDKDLDMALIHWIGSMLAIPAVAVLGWPPAAAWPFLIASVVIHIAYYIAVTGAYRHGDLGLTYPLMRGTAPLLVALSAGSLLGEGLSPLAWGGVCGVCAGVLLLGLSPQALAAPRAVAYALANALVIAVYTVVDGQGVRAAGGGLHATLQYVAALFLLDGWPYTLLMLHRRGPDLLHYARHRWPLALGGACASLGSYGIALWAMTRAPVAMVAALRETSVLFAVVMGTVFLKEPWSRRRLWAAAVIVAGVVALRLG